MTLSYLIIIGVMGRCDLNHACSLGHIRVLIRDNRDLPVCQRKVNHLANQMLIPLILRIDRHGRIAQHRLRTGRRHLQEGAFHTGYRIQDVPEVSLHVHMLYLCVTDRSLAYRTPVDQTGSLIDQLLLVQAYKYILDRFRTALVHRKTLSLPIRRGAHLLQLGNDPAAILLFPFPSSLQKAFTAQILLADALLLQCLNNLNLSRDAGMIRSRLPQRVIALHSLIAHQDILHCIIQRVSHMQLSCDIGRRHDNRKRLSAGVRLRMEISVFLPFGIQPVLYLLRIVLARQLSLHHLILFLPFDIKKRPSPLIRAKAAVPPYDYTLPAVTWHPRS